jgi:hypothetical protein
MTSVPLALLRRGSYDYLMDYKCMGKSWRPHDYLVDTDV